MANSKALFKILVINVGPENSIWGTAAEYASKIPLISLHYGFSLLPFNGKQSSIVFLVYVGNLGVPPKPNTGTFLS